MNGDIGRTVQDLACLAYTHKHLAGIAHGGIRSIHNLEAEIQRLHAFHKEDMRVTNESAHFHMLECNRLRARVAELEEVLRESLLFLANH